MSVISNYLSNLMINTILRKQSYTGGNIYVGLFTSDPSLGGTEVTSVSYARQVVTFDAPANQQTSNSADILFPISTEVWGTISYIALFDAVTGGNMLYSSPLEFSKTMNLSSQFKIPQNYLIIKQQ